MKIKLIHLMENILFFENPPKSCEEIVYNTNYPFIQDIKKLIHNSNSNRRVNNKKIRTSSHSQNAFMIYRRDKSANPKFVNMHSKDVSKVISNM